MENSGSDDEEDESAARRRRQMTRLLREEDFYQFVNNLSEEDYKLMRDNNLLGIPGETTLEELLRRLQRIKDNLAQNSDENRGGRDSSDSVSSSDSLLEWLNFFEQTENVTSEGSENQSWEESSRINSNSDDSRFNSEINFNLDNGSPNLENLYVPSTRLTRGDNMEISQRQVENPQSESTFIRPPRSEQSTTEALIEVPVTRVRRRARSRSPEHRRTRARTESSSAPNSMNECLLRFHQNISPETFEYLQVNEADIFSRIQQQGTTSRQQITGPELQNSDLLTTSGTRSAIEEESWSDTTSDDESWELEQINPIIPFHLEVGQVHPGAYSHRDERASRTPLISETPNNTVVLRSEQGGFGHMFPYFEQTEERIYVSTIRIPIHSILNTGLNDTTSVTIQSTFTERVTVFSDSSDFMDSDSDLVYSVSPSTQNMERAESPNERDGSDGRAESPNERDGSDGRTSSDFHPNFALISSSNSSYVSSFNSSPIFSSSSSDENSAISSIMFEGSNEVRTPSGSPSESRQESTSMSSITSDDSDSWTSLNLDHFFVLNEDNHDQPTGLTKAQIDNLAVRSFGGSGALKACSICITEYIEGNRLRILPCSHEFHVHCIDHWLLENSTCPICRGQVVDSGEKENSN